MTRGRIIKHSFDGDVEITVIKVRDVGVFSQAVPVLPWNHQSLRNSAAESIGTLKGRWVDCEVQGWNVYWWK